MKSLTKWVAVQVNRIFKSILLQLQCTHLMSLIIGCPVTTKRNETHQKLSLHIFASVACQTVFQILTGCVAITVNLTYVHVECLAV